MFPVVKVMQSPLFLLLARGLAAALGSQSGAFSHKQAQDLVALDVLPLCIRHNTGLISDYKERTARVLRGTWMKKATMHSQECTIEYSKEKLKLRHFSWDTLPPQCMHVDDARNQFVESIVAAGTTFLGTLCAPSLRHVQSPRQPINERRIGGIPLLASSVVFLMLSTSPLLNQRRPGPSRRRCSAAPTGEATCASTTSSQLADPVYADSYHDPTYGMYTSYMPDDTLIAAETGGADAEICELQGYDMGDTLVRKISRRFTEAERHAAYEASGFNKAVSSKQPVAIWVIGPSACGKSTLTKNMVEWAGIHDDGFAEVDGDHFRMAHQGYQAALRSGKQRGCVWWQAYVGIRENVNEEKQKMLVAAMESSKHLVIPSTCLHQSQCIDLVHILLQKNYIIHIAGAYGSKQEIIKRGRRRALEKGKRYEPREFEVSVKMFGPMLKLCTGRYRMVCTTKGYPHIVSHEGEAPLSNADIKIMSSEIASTCHHEAEF